MVYNKKHQNQYSSINSSSNKSKSSSFNFSKIYSVDSIYLKVYFICNFLKAFFPYYFIIDVFTSLTGDKNFKKDLRKKQNKDKKSKEKQKE